MQKDTLKKSLDRKTAEYAKNGRYYADYPPAEEAQKASMQRAQTELDAVEKQLEKKQAGLTKIIGKIVEKVIPSTPTPTPVSVQGMGDKSFNDLKNLFDRLAQRVDSIHIKVDSEHEKWSDAQADWGYVHVSDCRSPGLIDISSRHSLTEWSERLHGAISVAIL
jgi:hypothetical protein